MTAYTPNFSDPRIQRRCVKAIDFVELYLKDREVRPVAQTQLTKHLGNTARPLAQYLKDLLLECVDPYWNMATHQCKRYRSRRENLRWLKQQLGLEAQEPKIKQTIIDQLATGDIVYKEQGHRSYHELQNLPKRVKRNILTRTGYRHEYDIQCAAQTLILQHARHLGFNEQTPHLDAYILDRQQIRTDLAQDLGLDSLTIKRILHALLTGGKISTWHDSSIFSYVNYNPLMISALKQNTWIQEYQRELRSMWRHIRSQRQMQPGQRLNSKIKSEIYRELENQVRKVIVRYLKKTKNKHFFEHDGWSAEHAVDIRELVSNVKRTTGFVIDIDWTINE